MAQYPNPTPIPFLAAVLEDCTVASRVGCLQNIHSRGAFPQVEARLQLMHSALTVEGRINELKSSLKTVSRACEQLSVRSECWQIDSADLGA
jgi:hypothetical protein